MPQKMKIVSLVVTTILASGAAVAREESAQAWHRLGQETVKRCAATATAAGRNVHQRARNIILFVGDGMGVSTVTAARIYEGQKKGMAGEENELFFETFPNIALAKTYNTNQQTPDSAGTMTAMMTGVKTKAGVISVDQDVVRGDCSTQSGNELTTALEFAERAGMSTGVVSTARITHATPAATYAHIADRNFEDDRSVSAASNPDACVDIARQLVEFPQRFHPQYPLVDGLEVAMGGGRRSFLKRVDGADPEDGGMGERIDGRDLVTQWLSRYKNAAYVWNKAQFDAIDTEKVDHLLGLFDMSHMEYELDRDSDTAGEPSLSEMTAKAVRLLQRNRNGFFLHVESGRIDHAHHATNPRRALEETVEFSNAVKTAYQLTDPEDTLIIVTADHSHVFTIAGYPTRGNPILGKVVGNDAAGNPRSGMELAADNMPYTTLGYANGRDFGRCRVEKNADAADRKPTIPCGRSDLSGVDTGDKGFHFEALVPLGAETHGGEDVAVYASGPGSALVNGVMEQNAIYHIMNQAGRLELRHPDRAGK